MIRECKHPKASFLLAVILCLAGCSQARQNSVSPPGDVTFAPVAQSAPVSEQVHNPAPLRMPREVRAEAETGRALVDGALGEVSVSDSDVEAALRAVAQALARGDRSLQNRPAAWQSDREPRVVFLSVSDGLSPARVAMGTGNGWQVALEDAVGGIQRLDPGLRSDVWIKVDIVESVGPPTQVRLDRPLPWERSLDGIAFADDPGLSFLPEELVTRTVVNKNARLSLPNLKAYLPWRDPDRGRDALVVEKDTLLLRKLTTVSYFFDGEKFLRLYRGHRLRQSISPELALEAAKAGGDYLRRSVLPDGSFVYSYFPKSDTKGKSYNMVRHAGTVYSMLDLWETTREPELLKAAERALDYLVRFVRPYGTNKDAASMIVDDGKIKLGGVGLAAVALVEHGLVTKKPEHLELAKRLCRYIQLSVLPTGEFIHQRTYPDLKIRDFTSQYYPGEALLALARLYSLERDESLLDTAERGAHFLIEVRDRGVATSDLTHDHWLLCALNELYRLRPDPVFLTHAMRIAQAITMSQNRTPEFPDYLGSYYIPPRSTPTATRTEGLLAAYQLARDFQLEREAEAILETIELNVEFQLETQVSPERALYLQDPQRCLGGFTRSLTNFEIRIDYVQHNISALILLYRLLKD